MPSRASKAAALPTSIQAEVLLIGASPGSAIEDPPLRLGVLDLDVNAPLGDTGMRTTWIITAGQASLIVEVRDTVTNALLGRVADRRETQDLGRQIATSATNIYDFRLLFTRWADICVRALGELKSVSPVPTDLKALQSL